MCELAETADCFLVGHKCTRLFPVCIDLKSMWNLKNLNMQKKKRRGGGGTKKSSTFKYSTDAKGKFTVYKCQEIAWEMVLDGFNSFLCKPSSPFILNSFLPCSFFLRKSYFNIKNYFYHHFQIHLKITHAPRYFFPTMYLSFGFIHAALSTATNSHMIPET